MDVTVPGVSSNLPAPRTRENYSVQRGALDANGSNATGPNGTVDAAQHSTVPSGQPPRASRAAAPPPVPDAKRAPKLLDQQVQTLDPKLETPKPKTRNSKPKNQNPRPKTQI